MMRTHFTLTMLAVIVLAILFSGCGSTPTPDPSIVWSDDFEDGDTEGWEQLVGENEHYISEGAVYFGKSGGGILYRNTVKTGTWSFDVFITENQRPNEFWFIVSELGNDQYASFSINIIQQPITKLEINHLVGDMETLIDTVTVREPERLTGWHHVDITRDEGGHVKIFIDREFVCEFNEDFPYDSSGFFYYYCCEGPALDNVVVRDQVIDIQPLKDE
jgi:hypothetical protein